MNQDEDAPAGLTDEELARIKRIKRRNLILALVAGIALAVLGFFGGKGVRSSDSAPAPASVIDSAAVSVVEMGSADVQA